MVCIDLNKWNQSLDELRVAALHAPHPRSRERFQALYLIASGQFNPIERLWDWLREEVTRGHCHGSVAELLDACQAFIARINRDPRAVVDQLWPKFELDPEFEDKLRVSN